MRDGAAFPGFGAGFSGSGNGPESPQALAALHIVGIEKPANSFVASGNARNHFVLDDQRSHRPAIAFTMVANLRLPEKAAVLGMEGQQVSVVRFEENLVSKHSNTAIDAGTGISDHIRQHRTAEAPHFTTGAGIQREDRVAAGDIHQAVRNDGRSHQAGSHQERERSSAQPASGRYPDEFDRERCDAGRCSHRNR